MKLFPLFVLSIMLFGCKNNAPQVAKTEKEPSKPLSAMRAIITDPEVRIGEKDIDFTVTEWSVSGDTLIVGVQHGGGCREHDWKMYFNGAIMKSLPPQAVLQLQHLVKDGPDPCRSIIRETLKFNLTSLKSVANGKLVVKWSGDGERSAIYVY